MPEGVIDAPLAKTFIPADLHDRAYLKPWLDKPWSPELAAEVFKKLDGAETLIGKKTVGGLPAADAKPEEFDKFYAQLRPEKVDDYEIPVKEGAKPDPEFLKMVRESFMAGDISKRQASKFMAKFSADLEARSAAQAAAQKKADEDFVALTNKTFGADNAKVLARVRKELDENMTPELRPLISKLDNGHLTIMAVAIEGILKKYTKEDSLNGNGGGGAADEPNVREEGRRLQALPAFKDQFHPDHAKTVELVNANYAKLKKA